jgi:hypothetical protein
MDARRGEQKGARDCTTRHRHLDTTALWAFPRAAMNVGSITQLTGYATNRDLERIGTVDRDFVRDIC